jgi:hypothetical protein
MRCPQSILSSDTTDFPWCSSRMCRWYGLAPHEIIQSPPSCQIPTRTKDTRGLRDPRWVRQGLHWAHGPFRGYQVKGALTAHPTRTSGKIGRTWTQCRPGTPDLILQFFDPRHENQMYGPHCYGGLWDWTPPLQYQQREWLESQYIIEASSRLPKRFWDMTQVHLATPSPILSHCCVYCKQPFPPPPTLWNLAF